MLTTQIAPNLWLIKSTKLRLFFDLQFRSIVMGLNKLKQAWPGSGILLDFGAGTSPYSEFIPSQWRVLSLDPHSSSTTEPAPFRSLEELPPTLRFDRVLVLEVLEHLPNPEEVLRQLRPRLTLNGEILISVPFSARIHPCPSDFRRWTPEGLEQLLTSAGYQILEIQTRGNDASTILAKLIYYFARRRGLNLTSVIALLLSPVIFLALLGSHSPASLLPESAEDPLGFLVRARPRP